MDGLGFVAAANAGATAVITFALKVVPTAGTEFTAVMLFCVVIMFGVNPVVLVEQLLLLFWATAGDTTVIGTALIWGVAVSS